ncbi:uncharacterized protein ASCRUDRAFT_10614 [Ascoidea rubescens DSM 1968]|uniref:Uncharacterized protein n=1 Tax=Ascoidea rubescens DSM 1968 TaxID=1344418 RepID=A0A1D2V8R6_9ASCO|nr:hypothetical protein ASCRUDRAFT_10614 [Ascoidea rubescens DSM 1968]ODV58008.1 hypothetical protein ASCRUDRAFT_10614 [Ascoidea rubescens DSM 1968]
MTSDSNQNAAIADTTVHANITNGSMNGSSFFYEGDWEVYDPHSNLVLVCFSWGIEENKFMLKDLSFAANKPTIQSAIVLTSTAPGVIEGISENVPVVPVLATSNGTIAKDKANIYIISAVWRSKYEISQSGKLNKISSTSSKDQTVIAYGAFHVDNVGRLPFGFYESRRYFVTNDDDYSKSVDVVPIPT